MSYLTSILKAVGSVVDKAVPFLVGARTKVAVVACPVLSYLAPAIAALSPQVAAVVPYVQAFLCSAAPLFAVAGLVRDSK